MLTIRSIKNSSFAVATIALLGVFYSTGSTAADTNRETRAVNGPITSVRLYGPIDMALSQGDTKGVILEGEAQELSKIKIDVVGGEMSVRYEQGKTSWLNSSAHRAPRAIVAIPDLRKVAVFGSGDVAMSAFNLKDGRLEIEVTGSGDVKLASLKAKALAVSIRGSGDVAVSGQVSAQEVAIAGSGDYSGRDLQSQTGAVSVMGSGDAKVWATDTLSVSIAGSGDVAYRGQPKLQQSIAGSGEVRQIN